MFDTVLASNDSKERLQHFFYLPCTDPVNEHLFYPFIYSGLAPLISLKETLVLNPPSLDTLECSSLKLPQALYLSYEYSSITIAPLSLLL
jgi:hypothetical protein